MQLDKGVKMYEYKVIEKPKFNQRTATAINEILKELSEQGWEYYLSYTDIEYCHYTIPIVIINAVNIVILLPISFILANGGLMFLIVLEGFLAPLGIIALFFSVVKPEVYQCFIFRREANSVPDYSGKQITMSEIPPPPPATLPTPTKNITYKRYFE